MENNGPEKGRSEAMSTPAAFPRRGESDGVRRAMMVAQSCPKVRTGAAPPGKPAYLSPTSPPEPPSLQSPPYGPRRVRTISSARTTLAPDGGVNRNTVGSIGPNPTDV